MGSSTERVFLKHREAEMQKSGKFKLLTQANGNIVRREVDKKRMIAEAAKHYGNFLTALGFDWKADDNSADTPNRVAKAWVEDLIRGCIDPEPKITQFKNKIYTGAVFQGDINVVSMCSHHNLPFVGRAYVAYVPKKNGKVAGLSKLNRITDWISRRPQLQEELTQMIHDYIDSKIENDGIMIMIVAKHSCCSNRGIGHDSTMITSVPSGLFLSNEYGTKDEFYQFVNNLKK